VRLARGCCALVLALCAGPLWPQAELWDRAGQIADRGKDLLPGAMHSVMEELDANGALKSVVEMDLRYSYDAAGKRQTSEVVRAIRDGRDVTEETRRDMAKGGRSGSGPGMFGFNGSIFGSEARGKTKILPGASWTTRGGRKAGLVPFEIGMGALGRMQGTAEIDAGSGIPAVVHATGSFPFVRDLAMAMDFLALPVGTFVLSRMEFTGELSAVLGRRRFHVVMDLGDYRPHPSGG
jgi:hypothetical protein